MVEVCTLCYCCYCSVVGPVQKELVQAASEESLVTVTDLHASEHYLVMVESCSTFGVTSSQNSTIDVTTTQSVVDIYGVVTALGILVVILLVVVVVGAVCFTVR